MKGIMMKKIIAVLLIVLSACTLASCVKKQEATVQKELKEDIPNAYVGDVDVEQSIKVADLEIIIKEKTFYINGIVFTFKEFENTEKLSTQMGEDMLDVYVKGGKLQKCVVYSGDNTMVKTYNIDGKTTSVTKCKLDEYGNKAYEAFYGSDGKLQKFYTAEYEKEKITSKYEYNAGMDLTAVIRYEYDAKGKLLRTITYGPDLKLQEVKE